uniref:Retrotransposon gag domain-containing protein n=1 Tax=Photinus pyralis TaxID=7054 RepID=A0A1Y1LYD9_PHOPY
MPMKTRSTEEEGTTTANTTTEAESSTVTASTCTAPETKPITTTAATDPITSIITALRQLLPEQKDLPTYSGDLLDDPKPFLQKIEETASTKGDLNLLQAATKSLTGDAAKWWITVEPFITDYTELKTQFLKKFDDRRQTGKLHAEFFAREQRTESCNTFLQRKVRIARGLNISMHDHLHLVRDLLHPDIRCHLRCHMPETMLDLVQLATEIEEDVRSRSRPAAVDTTSNTQRPPNVPKCRYCPQYHFHRDCPVLANRQQDQGNGSVAGSNTRPSN